MVYAQVIVSSRTNVQELTYAVPASIIPYISVGGTVTVPLRRKSVRGVVVELKRQVDRGLRGKLRDILAVDRQKEGFSSAQIATIKSLSAQTGASLAEVAYVALAYPSAVVPSRPKFHRPIFVQAVWTKRAAFYRQLVEKFAVTKRLVFILPTSQHAEALSAELPGAIAAEPVRATKTKQIKAALSNNAPIIIVGAQSLAFFPLRPGDFLIIDSPDHVGQVSQRRPYFSSKQIGLVRARSEGVQLIFGSELPIVADFPKLLRGDWRRVATKIKAGPITIVNRRQTKALWADLFQEKLLAAKGQRNIVFVASKGYSPVVYCPGCQDVCRCPSCQRALTLKTERQLRCPFCSWTGERPVRCGKTGSELIVLGEGSSRFTADLRQLLPNQTVVEVSSDTAELPGGNYVVATEKILSFPTVRFDTAFVASVDRMLSSVDPDGAWHLLQALLALSDQAKRLVIQTHFPDHWVWTALSTGNTEQFYKQELAERQKYSLPPYSQQIEIFGRSLERKAIEAEAAQVVSTVAGLLPSATLTDPRLSRVNAREYEARLTLYYSRIVTAEQRTKLRQALPFSWYLSVG